MTCDGRVVALHVFDFLPDHRFFHDTPSHSLSFNPSASNMGDLDDYDFSTGDAGASHIFNMEAGQIRVGG